MTELLRRLVAWVGLSHQPRQALQHPLYEPPSGASSLRYAPLPVHRSPYRSDSFIDGTTTVAVRPYLVAHEQRQQCREPRALDGVEAA
ncbi:hypothetical protein ACH4HG_09100 [Streptomyces coeruleorubidus]|uniref:Uncharacterized protein n=1 Tax=Streptomyces coeruleorubidus TaxID=116188 RepID=A0ABZ0KE44_STRC4|nr:MULTISPECIES: hypothetical protein [Streptomyces]WOT36238.1 hypothetical protein R5U08_19870 [Streptomyces coeruleorubidus]GGT81186.1 hypothetical protein GCM10010244_01680 [Streptomyces bellus]